MKKLLLLLMFSIVLLGVIGSVSALGNSLATITNVKSFNATTNTITIQDAFGLPLISRTLATVQLVSPSNNLVIYGKDRMVAQLRIDSLGDNTNVFQNIDVYDLSKGMALNQKLDRPFTYKVWTIVGTQDVKDYAPVCSDVIDPKNSTKTTVCIQKETGTTHKENVYDWIPIKDPTSILNGTWDVGIFTDVDRGDQVEWIPTIFGLQVNEWATWTESLNTGLIEYWKFDENSGATAFGSLGKFNLSLAGTPSWATGKIGKAITLLNNGTQFANSTVNVTVAGTNVTVNGWAYLIDSGAGYGGIYKIGANVNGGDEKTCVFFSQIVDISGNLLLNCPNTFVDTGVALSSVTGAWHMFTLMYDYSSNNVTVYVDASLIGTVTLGAKVSQGQILLNNRYDGFLASGLYDETGAWNRTLSPAELTQLFNGGTGITYTNIFNSGPTVTLNAPANNTNSTNATIIFNATVSDDSFIQNVSLLIDGVINQTNTTNANNSPYYFATSLPDGTHNWTYQAFDNNSVSTTAAIRLIKIHTTPPTVTLNAPADKNITTINTVLYNATANVSGSNLANMSLWTNSTGVWHMNQTATSISDNSSIIIATVGTGAGTPQATTGKIGMKFLIGSANTYVYSIKKMTASTATKAYIEDIAGTVTFASASFVGDWATLTLPLKLNSSANYRVVADNNGANYNFAFDADTFPKNATLLNYTMNTNNATNEYFNIAAMNVSLQSSLGTNTSTQLFSSIIPPGNTTWTVEACDVDGLCSFGTNRTIWYLLGSSININAPTNNSNLTNTSVIFSVTPISFASPTINVSIYSNLSGSWNVEASNSSALNNTPTNFTISFLTGKIGKYYWNALADDGSFSLFNDSNYTFNIISGISISLKSPANNSNFTTNNILFNGSITDLGGGISNVSLCMLGLIRDTNTSGYNGTYLFNQTLADGFYNWTYKVNNSFGTISNGGTRFFTIDSTHPVVNITYPLNITYESGYTNVNSVTFNLNYTASDTNLQACSYQFNNNGTNYTLASCNTNVTFVKTFGTYNLKVWANDTSGNLGFNEVTATYRPTILENSITFTNSTVSGSNETFKINMTYDSTEFTGSSVSLFYNGTLYPAVTGNVGDTKEYASSITIPYVATATNKTFLFMISLSNSTGTFNFNSTANNQTVNPFLLNNCSSGNVLYNFKMFDEENLTGINGTIEATINIYSLSNQLAATYNGTYNYVVGTDSQVCVGNLTQNYYVSYVIKHYGNASYFQKYRMLQRATISNSTLNQTINLYNLLNTNGNTFKITVFGSLETGANNLLIETTKNYVALNTNYTVESSVTDNDGVTLSHLIPVNSIYNFIISSNGNVIRVLNNYRVECQNIITGDCSIILNLAQTLPNTPIFEDYGNIQGSFVLDNVTSTMTFNYVSSNGNSHSVTLSVLKDDGYGNNSICDTTISGTSGSVSCIIPPIYTNSSLYARAYSDGALVGTKFFTLSVKPNYYGIDVLIGIFMYSCLVLLFLANPIMIVLGAILGMVFAIILITITGGSMVGLLGTALYFVAAGIIIIWQIGRRI